MDGSIPFDEPGQNFGSPSRSRAKGGEDQSLLLAPIISHPRDVDVIALGSIEYKALNTKRSPLQKS
jgi:hypothetical protein